MTNLCKLIKLTVFNSVYNYNVKVWNFKVNDKIP